MRIPLEYNYFWEGRTFESLDLLGVMAPPALGLGAWMIGAMRPGPPSNGKNVILIPIDGQFYPVSGDALEPHKVTAKHPRKVGALAGALGGALGVGCIKMAEYLLGM